MSPASGRVLRAARAQYFEKPPCEVHTGTTQGLYGGVADLGLQVPQHIHVPLTSMAVCVGWRGLSK